MNTICRAECKFGYQLVGTATAVCTANGNWNPRSSPKCTGKCFCVSMLKQTSWWSLTNYMAFSYWSFQVRFRPFKHSKMAFAISQEKETNK